MRPHRIVDPCPVVAKVQVADAAQYRQTLIDAGFSPAYVEAETRAAVLRLDRGATLGHALLVALIENA